MMITYSLNGLTFASFGLTVADSSGVVDSLKRKEPLSVNWPDAHGQVVDLLRPRFEARTIELECFLVAGSNDTFLTQQYALNRELMKAGLQRLRIDGITSKPLVFDVYAMDSVQVKKKWRQAGKVVGQFTIRLVEPQPVKWVLIAGSSPVSVTVTNPAPLQISWGDDLSTSVQNGNQLIVTHNYPNNGPWYVIVSGELDRATIQNLINLTTLWPPL